MALNGLLDIELSVPDAAALAEFWERHGLIRTGDGVLGTADRPRQLSVVEGAYRHLSLLHLGCDGEQDLAAIAGRLDSLGVVAKVEDTQLTCVDPVFGHRVVVEVARPPALTPAQKRAWNHAGAAERTNARADVTTEAEPRPPRRLGHIVLGTPHVESTVAFYVDGLGARISDQVLNGVATFARVEQDHHNIVIQPGPTSYINHYAFEVDDIDAIGAAGMRVLAENPEASVVGVGRHFLGSNTFWYLQDPAGGMFEFFSDLDQIVDEEAWERDHRRLDWELSETPVSLWGPPPPETFFKPADLPVIAAGREADGLV